MGFRYRKYASDVIGRPDIIFRRERVVVFVDGDYWHGRSLREQGLAALQRYYTPSQHSYWIAKIQRNVARDEHVTTVLRADGWTVIRMWESDVRKNVSRAASQVAATVRRRRRRVLRR